MLVMMMMIIIVNINFSIENLERSFSEIQSVLLRVCAFLLPITVAA